MDPELASFLTRHTPVVTELVEWGSGLRFSVTVYLGEEPAPLAFVTSARVVLLRGAEVLVQHDRDGLHILPGGRCEPGETLAATLEREVREETGWSLRATAVLGFLHNHHLEPMPPGYPYPYPDFLQAVSVGWALTFSTAARLEDGYEIASSFLPVAAVRALALSRRERVFLEAALVAREPSASMPQNTQCRPRITVRRRRRP